MTGRNDRAALVCACRPHGELAVQLLERAAGRVDLERCDEVILRPGAAAPLSPSLATPRQRARAWVPAIHPHTPINTRTRTRTRAHTCLSRCRSGCRRAPPRDRPRRDACRTRAMSAHQLDGAVVREAETDLVHARRVPAGRRQREPGGGRQAHRALDGALERAGAGRVEASLS